MRLQLLLPVDVATVRCGVAMMRAVVLCDQSRLDVEKIHPSEMRAVRTY
jgi:hypothetical protein